ncbi:hypothetical protein D3C76_1746950 [compost metagenome]
MEASVALLQQPVQPAADRAGADFLRHRGSNRCAGDWPDGADFHAAALYSGGSLQQGGGCAEGDGQQHRDGVPQRCAYR